MPVDHIMCLASAVLLGVLLTRLSAIREADARRAIT
jgi:hypothetical protein